MASERLRLFVDGQWRDASDGSWFAVRDPADGSEVGHVADATIADLRAGVVAAHHAFPNWAHWPAQDRAGILEEAAKALETKREYVAALMTRESGKPIVESRAELSSAVRYFRWAAGEAPRVYGRTVPASAPNKRLQVLLEPVGVVAALTPWNYPASVLVRKVAPALAAGCTVVLRPSSQTPFSAAAIVEAVISAGLPSGVLSFVPNRDASVAGRELARNRHVRHLTFTGSTAVGKRLVRLSAGTLKRVTLELGGHAPLIVFEDADLEAAAKGVISSKFRNAGQTCVSTNRLLVHRPIADDFLATLAARFRELRLGPGLDESTEVGPLISAASLNRIEAEIAEAIGLGGSLLAGGGRVTRPNAAAGAFLEPTLVQVPVRAMRLLQSETFGPVLAAVVFDTEEEAIRIANATRYGLAAYFFTRDLGRAFRVSGALEHGLVGCNDVAPTTAQLPSGGYKESGLGRENGQEGVEAFLETKSLSIVI